MSDTAGEHEHYYKSLTRRIIIIMVVVSVVPSLLISGTIRYFFQAYYQEKVTDHLKVLIKKHRQNIDTFLSEKLSNIQELVESYPLDKLRDETFLRDRLKILQKIYGRSFVDLGVVDEKGIQIAYAGPFKLEEADYSKAAWFKEAMQGDTYISDVFPGLRGLPHFIVTVRGETGGEKWILRATVDFDAFNSLVESIRIGDTGFAFILNHKGELQTKTRTEIQPSKEPYVGFLSLQPKSPDEVYLTETTDSSGESCVYVIAWLKSGQWLLAFQQTTKDAYSALYTARRLAVAILALGILGTIAAAVLLAGRVVIRIRKADREKQMMNERVIEAGKLASLGELAAGIAHEINNPVAVMVEEAGWMQDLLEEEELRESKNAQEFTQSLQQIRTQGIRCKEITHKLLSFARKTDPRPKDVQLNDLVKEVVSLCQQRARYATVKILTYLDPNVPLVHVSPTEMQQVLMNLINNSLDAIDGKGGTVEVKTRTDQEFVLIEVSDDGPGIPEAYLQRVFDPFFTTKPVGKGTGLGLSICYGIITRMGGKISVNSAVGVGTSFNLRIPIPEVAREQPESV